MAHRLVDLRIPTTPRGSIDFTFDERQVGLWVGLDERGLLLFTHSYVREPRGQVEADKAIVFKFGRGAR